MLGVCIWAWLMHFVDMSFNIMPILHPQGFVLHWMDLGCWAFMAGVVANLFIRKFAAHPPYPLKDPRLSEAMGLYHDMPESLDGEHVSHEAGRQGGKS